MGNRRQGRIIAIQTLYRYQVTSEPLVKLLDFFWLGEKPRAALNEETRAFAQLLITGTIQNLSEIDIMLKRFLQNWEFSRLARTDLAILRISIFSLLYMSDIPATVTIDEAVDLAREFGSNDSYRFINGVLDGIYKSINKKP